MKLKKSYIEIQADTLLYWYSKFTGTQGRAKMAALYPFIITTSKIHPSMREHLINHELIHFGQQKEMLIIGFYVVHVLEWFWLFFIKRISLRNIYFARSSEQEAYDNMFDLEYLKKRRSFTNLRKYWRHKPVMWKEYVKKVLEKEGFPIIYEWRDEPRTEYPEHAHKGKVSFYVVNGSVTFFGGVGVTIRAGQRIDVPIGILHTAQVGPLGCDYVVGQEIEGDA